MTAKETPEQEAARLKIEELEFRLGKALQAAENADDDEECDRLESELEALRK